MLQTIRDRAHGWIAWAIIVLISIPFALWGIQSYLGVGAEPIVAQVNGIEIAQRDLDQQVQTARMQLRERLGAAYDPDRFDDKRLRQEVLDEVVRETLLMDVTRRLGMRVSDDELRARILVEPAFQQDGRFDNATYERALELQGMSSDMLASRLRQQIVANQMVRAVAGSELVTQAERDVYQRLAGQKRDISWLRVPAARFEGAEPIGDDDIKAYYDGNAARFQIPEQVKLDYLVLDVTSLASKTEIPEDEVRRIYETEQARFGQPERRRVRHILLTVPPGADAAADRATLDEIEAVRKRLEGGEPFDKVAKEVSQDPGSKDQGGSLGEIEKGMMDPAFEQAAFSMAAGELSQPVKSRFGYHLIQVESVAPASVKPFDAVREQVRGEIAKQRAESAFYDMGERLANLVYESSDSLEPASKELGLEVRHSDWVARTGGEGILGNPKVTAAAFSEEVLVQRRNSDLIEPEQDIQRAVVVRVTDHREASLRPLSEVREQIVAALRKERGRKGAAEAAAAGAEKLRSGADWKAVAGEDKVEEAGLVDRNDLKLPPAVRQAAFTLPPPATGKVSVGTSSFEDGDAAIVRVTRVEDGKPASGDKTAAGTDPAAAQEISMLGQLMGRRVYDAMVRDMERRAKIEREPLASPTPEG